MLKTDLLLSCGHVQIVSIDAVINMPRIGELAWCERCKEQQHIADTGVAWHDTDGQQPTKPTEGQLPLFKEEQP